MTYVQYEHAELCTVWKLELLYTVTGYMNASSCKLLQKEHKNKCMNMVLQIKAQIVKVEKTESFL